VSPTTPLRAALAILTLVVLTPWAFLVDGLASGSLRIELADGGLRVENGTPLPVEVWSGGASARVAPGSSSTLPLPRGELRISCLWAEVVVRWSLTSGRGS